MRDSFLRINDLSVTYEKWGISKCALNGISLEIEKGAWVMFMGPNGSGKTSLLRCVLGDIEFTGNITFTALAQPKLYSVEQRPINGTVEGLTVFENLWLIDEQPPARRRAAQAKYSGMLQTYNLTSHLHQSVETLSGGQRQILAAFMASLTTHPVIVLDEPTAALDIENEACCLHILSELHRAGRTLLHVTHNRTHVDRATRVITLEAGRIATDTSFLDTDR